MESGRPSQGPVKRHKSSGGPPDSGKAKTTRLTGQQSYAKAAQEGLRMAIVCGYAEAQVSMENFANVKRAFGWAL